MDFISSRSVEMFRNRNFSMKRFKTLKKKSDRNVHLFSCWFECFSISYCILWKIHPLQFFFGGEREHLSPDFPKKNILAFGFSRVPKATVSTTFYTPDGSLARFTIQNFGLCLWIFKRFFAHSILRFLAQEFMGGPKKHGRLWRFWWLNV